MTLLFVHRDAVADLEAIRVRGETAEHGLLLAFLLQAQRDVGLLESLTEDWFGADGMAGYSVRKLVQASRQGRQLWRVKILGLKGLAVGYRVIYAFNRDRDKIYVLGIPSRDIAYDQDHPRIQRLIAVYDSLRD